MDVEWHLKKVKEAVASMRDELNKTNDPEEIELWEQGIKIGIELTDFLERILRRNI
jgi:hypothetical protein